MTVLSHVPRGAPVPAHRAIVSAPVAIAAIDNATSRIQRSLGRVVAVIVSVVIVGQVAEDGESNWWEGVQLLAVYLMLVLLLPVALWLHRRFDSVTIVVMAGLAGLILSKNPALTATPASPRTSRAGSSGCSSGLPR